jgi:riboflavin synthase
VARTFKVGLAPETLRKTYFSSLKSGQLVNLERASEIGGRNSGHFVQGHVDGTGTIIEKRPDQDSLAITVQVDNPELIKYIVPKGFIAIDGTSLTVVDVNQQAKTFSFMLIEYTQKKIIIPQKSVGDKVHLEVDVLGKYSETALAALIPRLESLEAKVETLERALAGKSPYAQPSRQPMQQSPAASPTTRQASPQSYQPSMVPPKSYQPPPKSTDIRPMAGTPRSTSAYLQNDAEQLRRKQESPMMRPVSPAKDGSLGANGAAQQPTRRGTVPGSTYNPGAAAAATSQNQQKHSSQETKRVNLNPEPPINGGGERKRFTSSPTGNRVPDTAHQETLPDPLL